MRIVSSKELAILLIESPSFLPSDIAAHTIESHTLLGPFFKLSPLQVRTRLIENDMRLV